MAQEAPAFDPAVMKKKKPRKSVVFEGVENGTGEDGELNGEDKATAERHSMSMFYLYFTVLMPPPPPPFGVSFNGILSDDDVES